MADDRKQTLIDAAQGRAFATDDGQSATQHPLPDLSEAQRFLRSRRTPPSSPAAGGS